MVVKSLFQSTFVLFIVATIVSASSGQQDQSTSRSGATQQRETPRQQRDPFADWLRFETQYQLVEGQREGRVVITAQMVPGAHIYSLTQKGTPPPSRIRVTESEDFELPDSFKPNREPTIVEFDPIFQARVEKHYGRVSFIAPLKLADGVNPEKVAIEIEFNGQVCTEDGVCIPIIRKELKPRWGGYYRPEPDEAENSVTR